MRLRDATAKGLDGFSVGAAEYAWRPSPSPPPLPLPHGERGRGREHPHLPRRPFRSLTAGVEGGGSILTFPAAPSAPSRREWKGEDQRSGGDTSHITPLPQRERGAGGRVARTFPAAPSAPSRREWKGEDQRSRGDTSQITPLPQRERGAGGEGGPHLPRSPLPLPHGESGRGRLEAGAKAYWQPSTQWLHRHSTCPIKRFWL